jgi:hypothetical protein
MLTTRCWRRWPTRGCEAVPFVERGS